MPRLLLPEGKKYISDLERPRKLQPRDALLRRVTGRPAPAFVGRERVLRLLFDLFAFEGHFLSTLNKECETWGIGGSIDREAIALLFETIRKEVLRHLPAYVCRRCGEAQKADPRCACRAKRWLTEAEAQEPGTIARVLEIVQGSEGKTAVPKGNQESDGPKPN